MLTHRNDVLQVINLDGFGAAWTIGSGMTEHRREVVFIDTRRGQRAELSRAQAKALAAALDAIADLLP